MVLSSNGLQATQVQEAGARRSGADAHAAANRAVRKHGHTTDRIAQTSRRGRHQFIRVQHGYGRWGLIAIAHDARACDHHLLGDPGTVLCASWAKLTSVMPSSGRLPSNARALAAELEREFLEVVQIDLTTRRMDDIYESP